MSIQSSIEKLENAGDNKINVANELNRLKALRKAGNTPPRRTVKDFEQLIKGCDNPELVSLYKSAINAIS